MQWLGLLPHKRKVWTPPAGCVLAVWSLHVVDSAFLPQSKEMHFRLTGDSELAEAVNACVNDCLSLVTCPGSSPPVAP